MPQLNPSPWLLILLFSWLILLTTVFPKIMRHRFTNEPATQATKKHHPTPWNWPWH
ncbi:ATP synthase F0 subunit 8 (mitochondrion) [Scleropages formosus]|uniref:ATP synthase complex subunit 8 n=1 Tax=Scleropages formosus TaxID=113540 RepID=Q85B14_SCLFO|nr:ATP synthase F0 subunit 8 [Scleropages formosus]AAO24662.1 ATPase 8 [Scleropages formosus]AAO24666.1 ATPase 8 [Scleropages formosus]AAO24668.1 ATPase 8 [Scleropages formosus]AAO24670.1 ATPase 8 [Scleropages formosus]AAO27440.1 ATPase subunit 8 [Scleropages formosus]